MTELAPTPEPFGPSATWLVPRTARELAIVQAEIQKAEATFWPMIEARRAGEMTEFAPDRRIAFHEAGHAIVGLLVGISPEFVCASAEGGAVIWSTPAPSKNGNGRLVTLMAGPMAEGIPDNWTHRPTDEEVEAGLVCSMSSSDLNQIFRCLADRRLPGSDRSVMDEFRQLEAATIAILARNDVRAAIRAVAGELMSVGRLTGDAVIEIASRHVVPGSLVGEVE